MVSIEDLVEYSKLNKLSHIPSALSMLTYVDTIFTNDLITKNDSIVLGKPFGSQAYYMVWKNKGYLTDIEHLSIGVKHDEIDFVDYSEETMGNALGVAAGIALARPNKRVWVNISDGALQMGSTLESIQYIGSNKIDNIITTIDYNQYQVTDKIRKIIHTSPLFNFFKEYGWDVKECDGHKKEDIINLWSNFSNKPTVHFYHTKKGYGIDYMECDPIKWHYKTI